MGRGSADALHAAAGSDVVVGGPSGDELLGDGGAFPGAVGGADLFVFAPDNGSDRIDDFERGKDRIDVRGYANIELADLRHLLHDRPEHRRRIRLTLRRRRALGDLFSGPYPSC